MKKRGKQLLAFACITAFIAGGLCLPALIGAGDLEPPSSPTSTMRTLKEIYDKVSRLTGAVEITGQTTSYATGDDGDLEKGVAWPGPPFTDNLDGTVTDNLTKLVWLKDANAFGTVTWGVALSNCNNLASGSYGLTDGSVPGDWRLPNFYELLSLYDYGTSNFRSSPLFSNMQTRYWSSTTIPVATTTAMTWAGPPGTKLTDTISVWPVRSEN